MFRGVTILLLIGIWVRAEEPVIPLPAVVVEGHVPSNKTEDFNDDSPNAIVVIQAGEGSKTLDEPVNDLGVPLNSMEKEEDISIERRNDPWIIKPTWNDANHWSNQFQFETGIEPAFRFLSGQKQIDKSIKLEGGLKSSRTPRKFRITSLNNKSRNETETMADHSDKSFIKSFWQTPWSQSLLEFDNQRKLNWAGKKVLGESVIAQQGMSFLWQGGGVPILGFLLMRQNQFESDLESIDSTQSNGYKSGIFFNKSTGKENFVFEPSFSIETIKRSVDLQPNSQFQRNKFAILVARRSDYENYGGGVHLRLERAEDQKETSVDIGNYRLKDYANSWDLGLELTDALNPNQSVFLRGRSFALLAEPSQRFGDGALLMASSDLDQEKGVRGSTGLSLKIDHLGLEGELFYESTQNEPVVVAVSPTTAKTLSLGSVIARGLKLEGEFKASNFEAKVTYARQEAINNSQIQWQTGQPLPGRPAQILKSDWRWHRGRWNSGVTFNYKSRAALDLTGLWYRSPQFAMDVFVSQQKKNWAWKVSAHNLLQDLNDLPESQFAGRAGAEVLEPNVDNKEIQIACEFLL